MPSINLKVIQELRTLGEATFLAELIDLFLTEGEAHVARIRDSVAARDAHALERSAHTLKGSSGNLGAMALSRLASDLQNAARTPDWTRIADLAALMEAEFRSARSELEIERGK